MRDYVERVPSISIPQPGVETTCRIAPILLQDAHLKEIMQQPLTTKERGLVDGDARALAGNRINFEVVRFVRRSRRSPKKSRKTSEGNLRRPNLCSSRHSRKALGSRFQPPRRKSREPTGSLLITQPFGRRLKSLNVFQQMSFALIAYCRQERRS